MADFPTKKGIPLHGRVGIFSNLDENVAHATAGTSRIQVFVSGRGISHPSAAGLDEDLRLLVQSFVQGSRYRNRETASKALTSDADRDIKIALHGLNLAREREQELHHLIRELVRKRVAGKEETK